MAKIKVTAAEGRIVSVDPSIATAPGNERLVLKHGDELEVDDTNEWVIRRRRGGDLVTAAEVSEAKAAAAAAAAKATEPAPTKATKSKES